MEPVGWFCSISTLQEINISGLSQLHCFPVELFENLRSLRIWNCRNLESFSEHDRPINDLLSLHSLTIGFCHSLAFFPEGGLPAPNLRDLKLSNVCNLHALPERMNLLLPSLKVLETFDCQENESFPGGGLFSNLEKLTIAGCKKLIVGRMQWHLQTLPCLSSFSI
ncbi:hypothetical protein Tsubulata_038354 [Turnera subulata]|uniref:Uncharacterized protein n=1 Tax=Turnera subulata TaxID=218843 RepID=A0A9Q0FD44_9ROSI|nr:hypothetical protein Tsubulata_038354 [Turnera subulata]